MTAGGFGAGCEVACVRNGARHSCMPAQVGRWRRADGRLGPLQMQARRLASSLRPEDRFRLPERAEDRANGRREPRRSRPTCRSRPRADRSGRTRAPFLLTMAVAPPAAPAHPQSCSTGLCMSFGGRAAALNSGGRLRPPILRSFPASLECLAMGCSRASCGPCP